jgi:hypothetical protein
VLLLLLLERILPEWNLLLLLLWLTRLLLRKGMLLLLRLLLLWLTRLLLRKRMLLLLRLLLLLHDRKSKIHSRLLHSRRHERSNYPTTPADTTAGRRQHLNQRNICRGEPSIPSVTCTPPPNARLVRRCHDARILDE